MKFLKRRGVLVKLGEGELYMNIINNNNCVDMFIYCWEVMGVDRYCLFLMVHMMWVAMTNNNIMWYTHLLHPHIIFSMTTSLTYNYIIPILI